MLVTSCSTEVEDEIITDSSVKDDFIAAKAGPWQTIFWDGFDNFDSNKWTKTCCRTDYNSWRCVYDPGQVTTGSHNGESFLILRAEKFNDTQWISGHVKSKDTWKPDNGEEIRFMAKIKFNAFNSNGTWRPFHDTYGAWPAFWTVNETNWPTNGEIDIMEGYTFGNGSNDRYASNLFYGPNNDTSILNSSQSTKYYSGDVNAAGVWNDFEMRWRKNNNGWESVRIYVNGSLKKTYHNNNVDDLRLDLFSKHNVILNLNIGDSNNDIFDNSKNQVFGSAEMIVDYVLVQRRSL